MVRVFEIGIRWVIVPGVDRFRVLYDSRIGARSERVRRKRGEQAGCQCKLFHAPTVARRLGER